MFDLSKSLSIIHLHGDQVNLFLQNQLTNDVRQVRSDQIQWQAYCSRQGLVQGIFGLWGAASDYYLLCAESIAAHNILLLRKYALLSKVQVSLLPQVQITMKTERSIEKTLDWSIVFFDEKKLELGWCSIFLADVEDFLQLRVALIDHHFPWLCAETIDCFRPAEINLPELGIINFSKGCFPGQEIIARMHYRGASKQGFYCFHFPTAGGDRTFQCAWHGDFAPGYKLFLDKKQIGQLVDSVCCSGEISLSAVLFHENKDDPWTQCLSTHPTI